MRLYKFIYWTRWLQILVSFVLSLVLLLTVLFTGNVRQYRRGSLLMEETSYYCFKKTGGWNNIYLSLKQGLHMASSSMLLENSRRERRWPAGRHKPWNQRIITLAQAKQALNLGNLWATMVRLSLSPEGFWRCITGLYGVPSCMVKKTPKLFHTQRIHCRFPKSWVL